MQEAVITNFKVIIYLTQNRTFVYPQEANAFPSWELILFLYFCLQVQIDDRLYVHVPLGLSRDSFVALLDYAEEELEVTKVFVCLDRNNQSFGELVKAFRFMGFEHVGPNHLPSVAFENNSNANLTSCCPKNFHFLGYEFD